jgi:hypothetical protein
MFIARFDGAKPDGFVRDPEDIEGSSPFPNHPCTHDAKSDRRCGVPPPPGWRELVRQLRTVLLMRLAFPRLSRLPVDDR